MQNMIFDFFFQSALICPILTHFEKKNIFFQSALTWSQRRSAMFIENRPNVTFDQIMFQNVSKEIYFHIHIQIIIFGSAQFLILMFN